MVTLPALHARYQTTLLIGPQSPAHHANVLRQHELILRRAQHQPVLHARLVVVLTVGHGTLQPDARHPEDAPHLRLGAPFPTELRQAGAFHEAHLAGQGFAGALGSARQAGRETETFLGDLAGAVRFALAQAHVAGEIVRGRQIELRRVIVEGLLGGGEVGRIIGA